MAGPVDLAALTHHEEAGLVVQHLDTLLHIVGQGPHVVGAVDLIGDGVGVGQVLLDDDGLVGVGADGVGLGVGAGHGVAGLLSQLVQVGLVALTSGGVQQAAAGEVVEVGLHHLQADLIVAAAAGLVGVEGGGGGVVQVDGSDHADLIALLGFQLLGDGLVLHGAGLVHIDGAGVGLVSGGNGRGGGGGVGGEGVGVEGDGGAHALKVHEVQVLRAVQDGALIVVQAGLSLPVVLIVQGAQIVGRGLDLGIAHAVADEQEDVLGGLSGLVGHGGGSHGVLVVGGRSGIGGTARQGGGGERQSQGRGDHTFHVMFSLHNNFLVWFRQLYFTDGM